MPYSVGFIYRDGKPVRYDSGDYPACQASAMTAIDWQGFAQRKAAARAEGRFLGIALANYVEGTGLGPFEGATVRVQQTGRVSIFTGASAQGQGHKTTLAQICADQLGIAISQIDVVLADTAGISMGIGTFASRIVVNAGSSTLLAARAVRGKLLALAAHELGVAVAAAREGADAGAEASRSEQTLEQTLELVDGRVRLRADPQRGIGFAALARIAQAMPGFAFPEGVSAGLEDTQYFSPAQSTYCNGTHAVELEVDPASGGIRVLRYVVAHDSGKLINPLLVEGQVQGGVAHGLGNAWLEYMHYDAQSQPLTTTFADYLLPMATDVPRVEMIHLESPSPLNPLGAKGAGEGGTIPAAAVIVSAVEEALRDQVTDALHFTTSPLLPQWIVQRLHTGGRYSTPAR
jgi:carbon-monoxide dehydrogenase large subunit